MANDNQFKLKTKYIGTRGVKEYRNSINTHVFDTDTVLEIGCEWGTSSTLLTKKAKTFFSNRYK